MVFNLKLFKLKLSINVACKLSYLSAHWRRYVKRPADIRRAGTNYRRVSLLLNTIYRIHMAVHESERSLEKKITFRNGSAAVEPFPGRKRSAYRGKAPKRFPGEEQKKREHSNRNLLSIKRKNNAEKKSLPEVYLGELIAWYIYFPSKLFAELNSLGKHYFKIFFYVHYLT